MKILGIKGMSADQINFEIQRGGRFVIFQYTASGIIITLRRPSNVYFIRAGEGTISRSIGFSLITLLLGWWGIPWGPIYSVQTLIRNFGGGKDVTKEVVASLSRPRAGAPATAVAVPKPATN